MATSVWKGFLTFGLISIPIRLFSAARGERISLNQLHQVCHTRIKMPLFCPTCNRQVPREEIVKGYEYEKDQYVLFDEKELDKIEPESARSMEILEMVKLDEIDPLYFDASYYVTPEEEGRKAYQLLLDAMEESGYAAIAKLTMHQREHIVVVRPRANGMTLHTMYYTNEVREVAEYGQTDASAEPKPAEKTNSDSMPVPVPARGTDTVDGTGGTCWVIWPGGARGSCCIACYQFSESQGVIHSPILRKSALET